MMTIPWLATAIVLAAGAAVAVLTLTAAPAAITRPWTGIYVRVLAVILAFGAAVHVGNIAGLPGTPWRETPLLWRVMDVVLLAFNLVVAFGLWQRRGWALPAFAAGIVLFQLVPYTLLRGQFARTVDEAAALNGLIGTHLLLLGVLAGLLLSNR